MSIPLVYLEDGFFVFTDPSHPGFTYEFRIYPTSSVEKWVTHLSDKSWVTPEHINQFKALATAQESAR